MSGRAAFWAVVAGWWALFAIAAWWTPLQGGDWDRAWWAEAHGLGLALARHAARARDLGDVTGVLLAGSRLAHAALSPLVQVALLLGLVAHVRGRLPRPGGDDAILVLVAGALVWIAVPGAGVTLTHRPWVAGFVYGAACLVWLTALARLPAPVGRARAAALAVLGLAAGMADLRLGAMTLAVLTARLAWRRAPRAGWLGVAGLAAGLALRVTGDPDPALEALARRALRRDLFDVLVYRGETAELLAFVALAALLIFLRGRLVGAAMTPPEPARIVRVLAWMFLSPVVGLVAVFGEHAGNRALLVPMLMLIVAGLEILDVLAADRWARRALVTAALGIHAVAAVMLLTTQVRVHAEHEARLAVLRAASPGSVPTLATYRDAAGTFWFPGEDLGVAAVRESVARFGFGLGGLELEPPFRDFEPTAPFRFAIRGDAALAGGISGDLTTARQQFRVAAEASGRGGRTAELVVENLDFPERRGRPVIAARLVDGRVTAWRALAGNGSARGTRPWFVVEQPRPRPGDEVYVVRDGAALPTERRGDRYGYRRPSAGHDALVLCAAAECLLVDAVYGR